MRLTGNQNDAGLVASGGVALLVALRRRVALLVALLRRVALLLVALLVGRRRPVAGHGGVGALRRRLLVDRLAGCRRRITLRRRRGCVTGDGSVLDCADRRREAVSERPCAPRTAGASPGAPCDMAAAGSRVTAYQR
jgi:hypothetical protein